MMNHEVGTHPGLFLFLNRVKTSVFETSANNVAQTNSGRSDKGASGKAARKLCDKAASSEDLYAQGNMSATDLMRLVASHYDDEKLLDVLARMDEDDVEGKYTLGT